MEGHADAVSESHQHSSRQATQSTFGPPNCNVPAGHACPQGTPEGGLERGSGASRWSIDTLSEPVVPTTNWAERIEQ